MKKIIYFAHPYGGNEENFDSVTNIIREIVQINTDIVPISPIHAVGFLYNDVSYEKGMEYCFRLLSLADEIWFCCEWESSKGCNMEMEYAKAHNIPIRFI